jgi:hypothetical protein
MKAVIDMRPRVRLSAAEDQLIQILRRMRKGRPNCRILIEINDGVWDVTTSLQTADPVDLEVRGTGRTFSQAWNSAEPTDRFWQELSKRKLL